jgi:hypothetical protein
MKIITLTTENLKNIINQVINESLFTRRRGKYIESYLEDVLESIDPLDYEDEFKYVADVILEITDNLLSDEKDIDFNTKEYYKMFDEIKFFLTKHLYSRIQDHYDTVRTDY